MPSVTKINDAAGSGASVCLMYGLDDLWLLKRILATRELTRSGVNAPTLFEQEYESLLT